MGKQMINNEFEMRVRMKGETMVFSKFLTMYEKAIQSIEHIKTRIVPCSLLLLHKLDII